MTEGLNSNKGQRSSQGSRGARTPFPSAPPAFTSYSHKVAAPPQASLQTEGSKRPQGHTGQKPSGNRIQKLPHIVIGQNWVAWSLLGQE